MESIVTKWVLIRKIFQKDQYRFTIEWTDGKICDYKLSDLQLHCTCARCRDEKTGRVIRDVNASDEVEALQIVNVGRYALKIDFTKGCSRGIYPFSLLRSLGEKSC